MRKINYYIGLLTTLLFVSSCAQSEPEDETEAKTVTIRMGQSSGGWTRTIDADNLAVEQTVKNLSIFFTDPSSTTIAYKYVYTGFSISNQEQIITLPIEPADLQTKNVYVIANYDNESDLNALTDLSEMNALFTPEIDKSNTLNPSDGFCMFGHTDNVDFTDSSNLPVYVPLTRTCAKFRITLRFPERAELSTVNSFLIQKAAKYTHVVENLTEVLPATDYFNYAAALPLTDNGANAYTGITYVYEATQAPAITIYTHLNNSTEEQEFTTTLPVPQRNYLYDLNIYIYEEEATTRNSSEGGIPEYLCRNTLFIYNEYGEKVEEWSEMVAQR
ncbi:MAG: hypothetical protein LIP08_11560 [Bacteroides sp.]|nr:hypothetical protein [Bacteroides sp.]